MRDDAVLPFVEGVYCGLAVGGVQGASTSQLNDCAYHLRRMVSRVGGPARYGPFHRRSEPSPDEVDRICSSGQLWGRPRRNFYAGLIPAVKAWEGSLPDGAV